MLNSGVRGNGNVVSETRSVGSFNSVELKCNADVVVKQDDFGPIRMEGEDNLLKLIHLNLHESVLTIESDQNLNPTKPITIYVSAPEYRRLFIDGSGDIKGSSALSGHKLLLSIAGSGDMNLDVNVDSLVSSVSGSGDYKLSGKTATHVASINGSGDLIAKNLQTQRTTVSVAGSGDSQINASDEITASVAGSGDVVYYGEPKKLNRSIAGSGSIKKG